MSSRNINNIFPWRECQAWRCGEGRNAGGYLKQEVLQPGRHHIGLCQDLPPALAGRGQFREDYKYQADDLQQLLPGILHWIWGSLSGNMRDWEIWFDKNHLRLKFQTEIFVPNKTAYGLQLVLPEGLDYHDSDDEYFFCVQTEKEGKFLHQGDGDHIKVQPQPSS